MGKSFGNSSKPTEKLTSDLTTYFPSRDLRTDQGSDSHQNQLCESNHLQVLSFSVDLKQYFDEKINQLLVLLSYILMLSPILTPKQQKQPWSLVLQEKKKLMQKMDLTLLKRIMEFEQAGQPQTKGPETTS